MNYKCECRGITHVKSRAVIVIKYICYEKDGTSPTPACFNSKRDIDGTFTGTMSVILISSSIPPPPHIIVSAINAFSIYKRAKRR